MDMSQIPAAKAGNMAVTFQAQLGSQLVAFAEAQSPSTFFSGAHFFCQAG